MNEDGQNYWQGDEGAESQFVASPTPGPVAEPHAGPVTWQASEYIHHEKDGVWFIGLIVVSVVLVALSIFLIKSWTFTALIVVMAASVVIYARRPPRTLTYSLSYQGLAVNEKTYSLNDFRAFGIVQDGPLFSIVLIPVKRFMPSVNVYFPQEQGEKIVDVLGESVPMEHIELDAIDKLVKKLRF